MTPVTLIVPCMNEAVRLDQKAFSRAISEIPGLAFLFVDDGSTDETASVLAHLASTSPTIEAIYLPKNVGKGEAVRAGVRHLLVNGRTGLIGFWDADLATPIGEVCRLASVFGRQPQIQMAVGVRWPHLGVRIDRTTFRSLAGLVMRFLVRFMFRLPVYDTQCGAKVMTSVLAEKLFARPFVSRWLFDVELFRRMGRASVQHQVREIPLENYRDVKGSKLSVFASVCSFIDLFRIALTPSSGCTS